MVRHPLPRGRDSLSVHTGVEEIPAYQAEIALVLHGYVTLDYGAGCGAQEDEVDRQPDEGDCVFVD